MVKQFVRASKGHIEVDSKVNEGTTFRIFFPRSIYIQQNLPTETNVTNLVANSDQSAWIQPDTSIDKTKKSA
jgi:chemotaxis protein histidine kinase CheA